MKVTEIKIGKSYEITSGRNKTAVKVSGFNAQTGSWECETENGKTISVKDAKRFLAEVGKTVATQTSVKRTTTKTETKIVKKVLEKTPREDGTVSGIEAALIVLKEAGQPMKISQIMEHITARNLAKLHGKTPAMTVSAAIQREIAQRGPESRFVKTGRGLFAAK